MSSGGETAPPAEPQLVLPSDALLPDARVPSAVLLPALLTCLSVPSREGLCPASQVPPGCSSPQVSSRIGGGSCSVPSLSRPRLASQPHLGKTLPLVIFQRGGDAPPPCPGVLCSLGSQAHRPVSGSRWLTRPLALQVWPECAQGTAWCRGLQLSPLLVSQLAICSPYRPPES